MPLRTYVVMCLALSWTCVHAGVSAQATEGTIRGVIRDGSGATLTGVIVTVMSRSLPGPVAATSDSEGAYRLSLLPPGEYTLTAEHPGFSKATRDRIGIRAGLHLTIHLEMVRAMTETLIVRGEPPLLETSSGGQAVNVSGQLQQSLPLAARKHWSEFLRLVPGAVAIDTPGDQAPLFFIHGASAVSGSILVDGADISSAVNPWTGYVALPGDTVADIQVRTSGMDASAPLGMGAASNVAVTSGTNLYQGSVAWAYTSRSWVSRNTIADATSQLATINQPEGAIGGPLQRNHWWIHGSYRRRVGTLGLSRPADQVADMRALVPTFAPFDNEIHAHIALVKITGRLDPTHEVSGFYNYDATESGKDVASNTARFTNVVIGGHAVAARLTSSWPNGLMSRLAISWNNKSSIRSLVRGQSAVPSRPVFGSVGLSADVWAAEPSSLRATLDNTASETQSPYSKWTVTGDITLHKTGGMGSHEFRAGLFLQPRMHRLDTIEYANGGFALEEHMFRVPSDATGGTVPFHRRIYDAGRGVLADGHFSDNAAYVQDSWRPSQRFTVNIGVRVDRIQRTDDLFGIELQESTEIAPRVSAAYVLTSDQRNVVRASFMRLHDSPNVNQMSAGSAGTQGAGAQTVGFVDEYDMNLDGSFELKRPSPAATAVNPSRVVSADYHQPFVDEWTVGFRRQLPGQIALDAGFIHRDFLDRTALVERNGVYDGSRFLGYQDDAQSGVFLVTNNEWNWPVYSAFEIVGSKRTPRIELLGSYTRVWSHLAGTWQPNDPASFIQPDAFAFDRGLPSNDNRNASLSSAYGPATPWSGPEWADHVANLSGVYRAPGGLIFASSYTLLKGWWSGPILRTSARDPQFGLASIGLPNGSSAPNPLATTTRFAFETRSEGQFSLPSRHHLNLRIGREFRLPDQRKLELTFDCFNVLNLAGFQGFLPGASRLDGRDYGKGGNVQPPRTFQLGLRFSFE